MLPVTRLPSQEKQANSYFSNWYLKVILKVYYAIL